MNFDSMLKTKAVMFDI